MKNHDTRLRKLEARRSGLNVVIAPAQGTPEYAAFVAQPQIPGTIVIAHEAQGL